MKVAHKTAEEIRRVGLTALKKALGVAGTIRFLGLFHNGSGDYTAERHQILGNPSVDDIVEEIRKRDRKRKRKLA